MEAEERDKARMTNDQAIVNPRLLWQPRTAQAFRHSSLGLIGAFVI